MADKEDPVLNLEQLPEEERNNLLHAVWGEKIQEDIFKRWFQGFEFSEKEPLALIQHNGGPCAIIVPIQAFIIKYLLDLNTGSTMTFEHNLPAGKSDELLFQAITEVLDQCRQKKYVLVVPRTKYDDGIHNNHDMQESNNFEPACKVKREDREDNKKDTNNKQVEALFKQTNNITSFHMNLCKLELDDFHQVKEELRRRKHLYASCQGLLLVLYSVVFTHGLETVSREMGPGSSPLVDEEHGVGNQSLINLFLTGLAVPNVWNMDRCVDGLCLQGIPSQSKVGYFSLLEALKYCEVGSFLKSPIYPIWVLGSETHLTLFFSQDRHLVHPETPRERAARVFASYDAQDNGFVACSTLGEILRKLDLCWDPEYVNVMVSQLDRESLGIILLKPFLEEFFPEKDDECKLHNVPVYHYNGLKKGSEDQVTFARGHLLNSCMDSSHLGDKSQLVQCLRTKWPNVDVQWTDAKAVSLN